MGISNTQFFIHGITTHSVMSPFGNVHWEVQQCNMWIAGPTYKQLSVPVWSLAVSYYWNAWQEYCLSSQCQFLSLCIVSIPHQYPFCQGCGFKKEETLISNTSLEQLSNKLMPGLVCLCQERFQGKKTQHSSVFHKWKEWLTIPCIVFPMHCLVQTIYQHMALKLPGPYLDEYFIAL